MPTVTVRTAEGVDKFGRAGLRFTREPTTCDVTEDQLAQLRAEPLLEVSGASAPGAARASVPPPSAGDDDTDTAERKRPGRK